MYQPNRFVRVIWPRRAGGRSNFVLLAPQLSDPKKPPPAALLDRVIGCSTRDAPGA
jgi:hypothetical protein